METNLKYKNLICTDLGGVGGHFTNLAGENEICTLLGGTGGHFTEIAALNEICTIQGVTAGHSLNLAALSAIGATAYKTNLEGWENIQEGTQVNLFDPENIANFDMWAKGRSGFTMSDELGETPAILTPNLSFNGIDDLAVRTVVSATFLAGISGNYVEALVKVVPGERNIFFNFSDSSASNRFHYFEITAEGYIQASIRYTPYNNQIRTTNVLTPGWHIVKVESSGGAYLFSNDGGASLAKTVVLGADNGAWIAGSSTRISCGSVHLSTGITYSKLRAAWVKLGDNYMWVLNNPYIVYGIMSGNDMTITGSSAKIAYGNGQEHTLTKGYSVYSKAANPDIEVPNKLDGTELTITPPTGYTKSKSVEGSAIAHNLAESKIRFTHAFFDRSNATIWNDNARGTDYDAVNTKDFHITKLNLLTLSGWLNVGYLGRFFPNIDNNSIDDRLLLNELLLYKTDHKANDEIQILLYTGDITNAVQDGEGNYLVDSNGYLIIN